MGAAKMTPSNDALVFFIESQLRDALDNTEAIDGALAMLKVCVIRGDTPQEMMRKVIADFVLNALEMEIVENTA
jgi:hypothetical protein